MWKVKLDRQFVFRKCMNWCTCTAQNCLTMLIRSHTHKSAEAPTPHEKHVNCLSSCRYCLFWKSILRLLKLRKYLKNPKCKNKWKIPNFQTEKSREFSGTDFPAYWYHLLVNIVIPPKQEASLLSFHSYFPFCKNNFQSIVIRNYPAFVRQFLLDWLMSSRTLSIPRP